MSSSKSPSSSGNQDDPWEQLAEDLFGLEYGKEHAAHDEGPAPSESAAPESLSSAPSPSEYPESSIPPYEEPRRPASEPVEAPPRLAADPIEDQEEFALAVAVSH